jgi:hypothetical protein
LEYFIFIIIIFYIDLYASYILWLNLIELFIHNVGIQSLKNVTRSLWIALEKWQKRAHATHIYLVNVTRRGRYMAAGIEGMQP